MWVWVWVGLQRRIGTYNLEEEGDGEEGRKGFGEVETLFICMYGYLNL